MSVQAAKPPNSRHVDSSVEVLEQRIAPASLVVQFAHEDPAAAAQWVQAMEGGRADLHNAAFVRNPAGLQSIDPVVLLAHNAAPLLLEAPAILAAGLVKSGPGTLVLGNSEYFGNVIFDNSPWMPGENPGGGIHIINIDFPLTLTFHFQPPVVEVEVPRGFESVLSVHSFGIFKPIIPKTLLGSGPR